MAGEYKRRYLRIENLIYISVILISEIAISVFYIKVINRDYHSSGCMMDGITILSQEKVYMVVVLITILTQFKLFSQDDNAMIVLRYGDKRKLWRKQCITTLMQSGLLSGLMIAVEFIYAYSVFHTVYNWDSQDSFHYKACTEINHMSPKVIFTPLAITLIAWLLFTGVTYALVVLAMLLKNVFQRSIVAVIAMAALTSWEKLMGGIFLYLVPKQVIWTKLSVVIYKLGLVIVIAVLLSIAGGYVTNRKEYWGTLENANNK